MNNHTLQQVIDLAVKTAVLKAKKEAILECRPVGSYFITETEDDPNTLFGGGWQKLTGRYVLQCSDDTHKAGTTVEAGLPNITGYVNNNLSVGIYGTAEAGQLGGAFYTGATTTWFPVRGNNTDGTQYVGFNFSASRSNSIYGRSDTVQPPARIVNVWKRVS